MFKYLCNAFSGNMLTLGEDVCKLAVRKVEKPENLLEITSAIGHPQLATLLGVQCNRLTISLNKGDKILVAQYKGPRLEEGVTSLPDGAIIEWQEWEIL